MSSNDNLTAPQLTGDDINRFYGTLGVNMGQAFQLQLPPGRITGIILPHGALNVDGVGTVAFDEIGIIAVDDSQEFNDRIPGNRMELSAKR